MKKNSNPFDIIVNVGNLSSTRLRLNALVSDPEPIHLFVLHGDEGDLQHSLRSSNRVCVADLEGPGDASALEKHYHRTCLHSAQRISSKTDRSNVSLIRSLCDEQLLLAIQNTLSDDDVTLSMAEVKDEYLPILKRYGIHINESQNYWKYLKGLISERLPDVKFVTSLRRNEPNNLVLPTAVSKAMDLRYSMLDDGEKVCHLRTVAKLLREEIMQQRSSSFTGNFRNFENPSLLQFFLSRLLFGSDVVKVSGILDQEVDKTVDVTSQFLVQNTRTDRKVKHQPKKDSAFRQTVQTPLSVGLPLAVHSRVRDKNIIVNLSAVYVGSDYLKIIDLDKRVEQCVLQRMKEAGGFCLPNFAKKCLNTWIAIDNIDILEDTPTGQGTFHGTVIVMFQQDEDEELMKLDSQTHLAFEVNMVQDLIIKTTPLRFEVYEMGKRKNILSKDFTHTWALANYLATDDNMEMATTQGYNVQSNQEEYPNDSAPDDAILSVKEHVHQPEKLVKKDVMPTWAATKALLLFQSSESPTRTNVEVIAPLFKTSPTDYGTLYTVLRLTQGIAATEENFDNV